VALLVHALSGMRSRRDHAPFLLVASMLLALGCGHAQVPLPAMADAAAPDTEAVARGQYIVRDVAVCGHCHAADPKKDPDGPLSGGMEFRNWRLGIARASNLTPDATGLGSWSDAEIVRALRNGVSRDGRLIAPVMPYEWFHEMSDRDAAAVARYLRSLEPVRNEVRQSPNFWFRLGRLFLLKPKPAMAVSGPAPGATPEYGRYLANHAGLCADCHTQRAGLRQAPVMSRLLAGMEKPPAGFPARPSNLTPDRETGIGSWSEDDFLKALRTGVTPDGDPIHPFMPWHQNRRMTDDDLRAVYRYLRTLPPIRNKIE
jgi:mono/diheme cytochrome c family protein